MKLIVIILILCAAFQHGHLSGNSKRAIDDIAISLRKFAGYLCFQSIAENGGNMFLSPISIAEALAMVLTGARGRTHKQIKERLIIEPERHFEQSNIDNLFRKIGNKIFDLKDRKDSATVTLANRVFAHETFDILPQYVQTLKENLQAEVQQMNFEHSVEAAERINSWVNNRTNGMIPDLVQSEDLGALTRLVLVNALYFKAKWEKPMKPQGNKTFTNLQNEERNVEFIGKTMMISIHVDSYGTTVYLKYKSSIDTYMVITMPYNAEGWTHLLKYNSMIDYFSNIITKKPAPRVMEFSMPKFDLEVTTDMKPILKSMGMDDMFDVANANFSGITTREQVYVSSFRHKAKISVNEFGTKAAAASSVVILSRTAIKPIVIDKPFLFTIVRDGHVLFVGRVTDLE